jgi:DNA-binding NtrC family response regulator
MEPARPRLFDNCNEAASADPGIRFRSRVMHEQVTRAISYARSSATVLLTGENGTGKELFARLIHHHSRRARQRLVAVNCAALAESVVESELFGHERGAFTGAESRREGRFEWASGGTLLLDEISEISPGMQAKLLRVMEEGEFQRVGSNEPLRVDVRIVATCNRDLRQCVADGTFREDLWFRLNMLRLHLPPLRERPEDIPLLAQHFFQRYRSEAAIELQGFSRETLARLCEYAWPGNVRQLRNAVLRACVVAKTPLIGCGDLPELEEPAAASRVLPEWLCELPLDEIERLVILQRLERKNGNRTEAATTLGVTPRTLANRIRAWRDQGKLRAA